MHGNHVIGDFLGRWICPVISGGKAGFLGTALGSGHLLLSQGDPVLARVWRSLNPFSVMEMRVFWSPSSCFGS